jgi:hypothetical protein
MQRGRRASDGLDGEFTDADANEDERQMTLEVRYLSKDEIEKEAELLLAEYAETIDSPIKFPVPVDEVTTYHLALRLGFADLHEMLRIPMLRDQPDILGAIWVDTETIVIDRSLDPKANPSMFGRYRFSVAHEIGHWRLHRSYVATEANQRSLFEVAGKPAVICRSSRETEPIEWQANFYASCLLMPRRRVHEEWKEVAAPVGSKSLTVQQPTGSEVQAPR